MAFTEDLVAAAASLTAKIDALVALPSPAVGATPEELDAVIATLKEAEAKIDAKLTS